MTDHFDVSTLNWVKVEIDATLAAARLVLERYAEDPRDEAQIHFCASHLHQVAGTLEMVELHGAARFAAEMERLADALPAMAARADALEVLTRTLLLLPDYLEVLQGGEPDSPMTLLPLLNELRRARGAPELTAAMVFEPDLSVEPPAPALPAGGLRELAGKLRPRFQAALVSLLRGTDPAGAAQVVQSVVETLREAAGPVPLRRWLWVGGALAESLASGALPLEAPGKLLLGKYEQLIRQLAASGEPGLDRGALDELLRMTLFALAKAAGDGPRLAQVRTAFRLDALVPSAGTMERIRAGLGGFNAELRKAVSRDVTEELLRVKERLDLFGRSQGRTAEELRPVADALSHIADVLGLLRENTLGERLREQVAQMRRAIGEGAAVGSELLMGLAESLLGVESALSDWGLAAPVEQADDPAAEGAIEGTPEAQAEHRRLVRQVMGEAKDDLVKAREAISAYVGQPGDKSLIGEVPRLLHGIAGSLVMLSYRRVAQILKACQRFVERDLAGAEALPPAASLDALADAMMSVEYYLEAFVDSRVHPSSVLEVAERAVAKLGYPADQLPDDLLPLAAPPTADAEPPEIYEVVELDAEAPGTEPPAPTGGEPGGDDEIAAVFIEEAEEEFRKLDRLLPLWAADPSDAASLGELRRSFHTLKGSGRLVGATALGELAWACENLVNRVMEGAVAPDGAVVGGLEEAQAALPRLLAQFSQRVAPGYDVGPLEARLFQLAGGKTPPLPTPPAVGAPVEVAIADPELRDVYTQEALTHLAQLGAFIAGCRVSRSRVTDGLVRALHTLCGSSRTAGVPVVAELTATLERYARARQASGLPVEADAVDVLAETAAFVEGVTRYLRGERATPPALADLPGRAAELLAAAAGLPPDHRDDGAALPAVEGSADGEASGVPLSLASEFAREAEAGPATPAAQESALAPGAAGEPSSEGTPRPVARLAAPPSRAELPSPPASAADAVSAKGVAPPARVGEYDRELLAVFLEEGQELLNGADETLQLWSAAPDDKGPVETLQRQLHTLKGGARMAGIQEIGDLGHSLESMLVAVAAGSLPASRPLFGLVQRAQDLLAVMVEQVRRHEPVPSGADLIAEIEALVAGRLPFGQAVVGADTEPAADQPGVAPVGEGDGKEMPAGHQPERRQSVRQQYDLVRVRSDLLDNMVNVAGEASIFRSRVEQQITLFRANLGEMMQVVERLRERLRLFEIETEAQIQSRYEEAATQGYEDFDPLEFDRFTHMQQLSRSMVESVGDLSSIGASLQSITREAETLLLQQARINTDLQEGLMHTRMVPLVQNAPRLRRIVRQTCDELGKEAELRFKGAEVEMDRTIVERIMAPLEHLLRNAVSHGIEPPDAREALGKPRNGTIVIHQIREGNEVLVRVSDDGAGIDVGAVRAKAIERGLLAPEAELSDKAALRFILESGFSTAEAVTQIAGRGVGMDVVNSEVRNLNGSLAIESEKGKGTTFTIRLPMTLTVSRALLVHAGDDIYAIPLLSIAGIVRASDGEIAAMLARERPTYQWLGEEYDLMRLSTVLGRGASDHGPDNQRRSILLAHSGDHRAALVVDGLIGSREIVVKPVGRQLGSLRAVSGATILGDGRVVLILEVPALIRAGLARRGDGVAPAAVVPEPDARPTIMVVDDSITVRKVTSRLLERNDMVAVSAKDGVEAVALLQDTVPDLMLLDIEMPRMDGYELAAHVRNEPRLRKIPIIMITSRSGEKHRQRAMQTGVDIYMTKPFQESELLANIRTLLHGAGAGAKREVQ